MIHWHSLSVEESFAKTDSRREGLTAEESASRIEQYGENELKAQKKSGPLIIFLRQFADVMILVLVGAAIISALIGEIPDTIVIFCIIVLNAVIGFFQEYRAEKAMEALSKMAAPVSKILRNGQPTQVPSVQLVPGEIVLLEAGNVIPADLRLIEGESLKINEASLTGESHAVEKFTDALSDPDLPIGDRTNMAFKGTMLTNGHGKGLVIATGMQTELGKIAGMLDRSGSTTPLQIRLNAFSRRLTLIIIGLCLLLFLIGHLRGDPFNRLLLTSISLAVAAIPEALPAVVSVSLALGARRLAKQEALIRKLYAVETLGSVTYICTDKTGTLTRNEMEVKKIWSPTDELKKELLLAMSHNHDVMLNDDGQSTGDPTEIAMAVYAKDQDSLKRIRDIPFDSNRKAMTTIHRRNNGYWIVTKGASDQIGSISNMDQTARDAEEGMAANGMRVIAFAARFAEHIPETISPETIEKDLDFIGLVGLMDPPRDEARDAIKQCKNAGIVPVMITGDHPITATAIAKDLGIIVSDDEKTITGRDMEKLGKDGLEAEVEKIRVYARVSPEQKLHIVEALQARNQFVSMTGDGVNDAPALKQANIGVAMGITGTDVTKEASSMILLNDNFATIVKAVAEGRRIYDNIRKFIRYILTGNAAEIWSIFLAPVIGMPIPLLPVHILWINLITDGLPALALAAEAPEKNIMDRPPRHPNESIFAHGLGRHILWAGLFIGMLTLGTQWYSLNNGMHWQTMVFSVLCFAQLWHVMAIRSEVRSAFSVSLFTNIPLLLAVLGTIALQIAVIYLPTLNVFFHTEPLTLNELLLAFGISGLVLMAVEIEKLLRRKQ